MSIDASQAHYTVETAPVYLAPEDFDVNPMDGVSGPEDFIGVLTQFGAQMSSAGPSVFQVATPSPNLPPPTLFLILFKPWTLPGSLKSLKVTDSLGSGEHDCLALLLSPFKTT